MIVKEHENARPDSPPDFDIDPRLQPFVEAPGQHETTASLRFLDLRTNRNDPINLLTEVTESNIQTWGPDEEESSEPDEVMSETE